MLQLGGVRCLHILGGHCVIITKSYLRYKLWLKQVLFEDTLREAKLKNG